jgi:hypothetical protein
MTVEIQGRKPKHKTGEYYRIHRLAYCDLLDTLEECHAEDLLGTDVWTGLRYADGVGPTDPEVCEKLAAVIEQRLEDTPENNAKYKREFVTFLRTCGGFKKW